MARRKTCGKTCFKIRVNEFLNPDCNGTKLTSQGYVEVRAPEHPKAGKQGYVKRARLVMEKKLGRFLTDEEVVHHIDFDRANDAIDNLMLFESKSEHMKFHYQDGRAGMKGKPKDNRIGGGSMNDIYIVAYTDENGNVTGFPKGGGSSTKPSIKAHDKLSSAKRSARFFIGSEVVRAVAFEVVKEDE